MLASMAARPERVTEQQMSWFYSPITGELPLLSAEEFSPGNIYLRELTEDEAQQAAESDEILRKALNGGYTDSATGEFLEITMLTGVYYYRVYGLTGVLQAGLLFSWAYPGQG